MSPPARKRSRRGVAPPIGEGWRSSDEDEVERRRRRGVEEETGVRTLGRVPAFSGRLHRAHQRAGAGPAGGGAAPALK